MRLILIVYFIIDKIFEKLNEKENDEKVMASAVLEYADF